VGQHLVRPGKERDAASALMGQGADVVTHHTDSTATVAAAEEKGRMAVAYHSNMAKFARTRNWPPSPITGVTTTRGARRPRSMGHGRSSRVGGIREA